MKSWCLFVLGQLAIASLCYLLVQVLAHDYRPWSSRGEDPDSDDSPPRQPSPYLMAALTQNNISPQGTRRASRSDVPPPDDNGWGLGNCVISLCRTEPTDWDVAVSALNHLYELHSLCPPKIITRDSPLAARQTLAKMSASGQRVCPIWRAHIGRMKQVSLITNYMSLIHAACNLHGGETYKWRKPGTPREWRGVLYAPCLSQNHTGEHGEWVRLMKVLAREVSMGYVGEDTVLLAANPREVHIESSEDDLSDLESIQFHADGGPALEWPDDFKIHMLHGVRVPSWLAREAPEDIEAERLADVHGALAQRAFLQKLGMERCLEVLDSECIDARGDYRLLEIHTGFENYSRMYLKMSNPSLGVWHVEAVHPSCSTVQEAINYRRYGEAAVGSRQQENDRGDPPDWNPDVLT